MVVLAAAAAAAMGSATIGNTAGGGGGYSGGGVAVQCYYAGGGGGSYNGANTQSQGAVRATGRHHPPQASSLESVTICCQPAVHSASSLSSARSMSMHWLVRTASSRTRHGAGCAPSSLITWKWRPPTARSARPLRTEEVLEDMQASRCDFVAIVS